MCCNRCFCAVSCFDPSRHSGGLSRSRPSDWNRPAMSGQNVSGVSGRVLACAVTGGQAGHQAQAGQAGHQAQQDQAVRAALGPSPSTSQPVPACVCWYFVCCFPQPHPQPYPSRHSGGQSRSRPTTGIARQCPAKTCPDGCSLVQPSQEGLIRQRSRRPGRPATRRSRGRRCPGPRRALASRSRPAWGLATATCPCHGSARAHSVSRVSVSRVLGRGGCGAAWADERGRRVSLDGRRRDAPRAM